jgi:hypothetical protein
MPSGIFPSVMLGGSLSGMPDEGNHRNLATYSDAQLGQMLRVRLERRRLTSMPELSNGEMQVLAESRRNDLKFTVLTATDNDGNEVAELMFVRGENGALGYTPLCEPRPAPMCIAFLVEQFNEQHR